MRAGVQAALALFAAFLISGWASPPGEEEAKGQLGEAVEFSVFRGSGGPGEASTRTARSDEAWSALWAQAGREPEMRLGAGQMGAGIFLGMRPTGGYAVEILAVVENDGRLEILAKESAPGPDEIVTQALTYPWAIVLAHAAPAGEPVIRVLGPKNDE